jgi:predicted RNase H-like HicB family nuclease
VIYVHYDGEADVYVGKDDETGIMSQGESSLEARLATEEAVKMHTAAQQRLLADKVTK